MTGAILQMTKSKLDMLALTLRIMLIIFLSLLWTKNQGIHPFRHLQVPLMTSVPHMMTLMNMLPPRESLNT